MTPEEKFLFDLQGYLIIKNVLTPSELSELNAIADERFPRTPGTTGQRTSRVTHWGAPYQALIDHPTILPYLAELIDSKFRLDHDYCIFMHQGDPGGSLHGGEGHEGDHWYKYRDGVMRNGLCVVTFFLTPAGAGDGGFACIPGTHKSHFIWLTDTSCWSWLGDCGRPFRPDRQDPSRPGERYRGRIRGRA